MKKTLLGCSILAITFGACTKKESTKLPPPVIDTVYVDTSKPVTPIDTSIIISRISQFANNTISTKVQLEFKKSIFSAEEYPELQEFYKQLYGLLNEQYVIRKKQ